MSERLPGITDEELLRRVMMGMRKPRGARSPYRWVEVMRVFGLGSTYAAKLCRDLGYDPDEELKS